MSSGFSTVVPDCVFESCYEHEGVIMPKIMPLNVLLRLRNFASRPDDLFIVTYPKAGTTWTEQLTLLIQANGNISKLNEGHVMMQVPFLEIVQDLDNIPTSPFMIDIAEMMTSPRILKSHSHYPLLPLDIACEDPIAKVLYVARNPKDTAASFYNFCLYLPQLPSYESWDIFFEEFLAGKVPQGCWFKNVLPWWRKRNHPNVLFLKYEDMKKDLPGAVRQISKFMCKSLTEDVVEEISTASTFKAMKIHPSSNPDTLFTHEGDKTFMRNIRDS